jgi:VWFA-related protein
MPLSFRTITIAILAAIICVLLSARVFWGQTPTEPKRQDQSDVLRVFTELVQTDVMVFDKQGRFVDGLKKEDFELRIDGQPKPVEFFERVTTGSVSEESQLAAARGSSNRTGTPPTQPIPLDRGRPIFFYVDDLHLDLAGVKTATKLITKFIDDEMGQNDEAAITSASGQIGFLQQLTDNRTVLRAALARLKFRSYSVRDFDRPTMTEYQALLIDNYDREVTAYFIEETLKNNPGMRPDVAETLVRNRSRNLLLQASSVTGATLSGLEDLVRSARTVPGRKLIFFISDGFFLDRRNSGSTEKMQQITSAAAKSGVVIYSMDARGLVASLADPSDSGQFDVTGRLARAASGELFASQDALNALARDTGGRPFFNTNSLEPALKRALKETSTYYLLAWKPEHETKSSSKFRRIEVKVVGKPELSVLVRRGFFDVDPQPVADKNKKSKEEPKAENTPQDELRKVIVGRFPERSIPVSVSLSYINTPDKGPLLSALMQINNEFLTFEPLERKQVALVDVAGTFLNDQGQVGAGFNRRLTVRAASLEAVREAQSVNFGHSVVLKPGLYQVRVAARDAKTGRAGSAHAWIEIPDLSSGQLTLSSVLLGARSQTTNAAAAQMPPDPAQLSVDHNFTVNDHLRFMVYVYNAAPAADAKPDLAIQLQVLRDNQPVDTTPLKKVSTEGVEDLKRLPYAAELSLAGLPAGRYILQLTAVDRVSKRSASQQTRFEIE